MIFEKTFDPIWADFDPNNHMRHTAYNNYAAEVRVALLTAKGYNMEKMLELDLGPVLLTEETKFLREIRQGEKLRVDVEMLGLSADGRFWNMRHHLYKNGNKLSAIITVQGAWIDLKTRKIKVPPSDITEHFLSLSKSEDYKTIEKPKR